MSIKGIWVPLVTPFKEERFDENSYERLVEHYIKEGVDGLLPLGTTGETPTLTDNEYEKVISKTMEITKGRVPVIIGLGGNNTKAVIEKLKIAEKYKVDGILSVSPYYNRPDQRGIIEHFTRISDATDLDIVLYNIPYRTGRNMDNSTILKLSEKKNIVGIKDASGDFNQTLDLLLNKPEGFSILTGEDNLFYSSMTLGADGGILASAHIRTNEFIKVYNDIKAKNYDNALSTWKELSKFIPLLFKEPNPTPIKYLLEREGLIDSEEVRLPLLNITKELRCELDLQFK